MRLGTRAYSNDPPVLEVETASLNGRKRLFSPMDCRESIGYDLVRAGRGNSSGVYSVFPASSLPQYYLTQDEGLNWETVKRGFG